MKRAGIRVWVLTGDKVETAMTIGYSCNLLQPGMINYQVVTDNRDEISQILEKAWGDISKEKQKGKKSKRGIIVKGDSLSFIMEDKRLTSMVNFFP